MALLSIECHLPAARSLKDKRMVLQSVKGRLRSLNVSVAEVEHQDLWQRAGIAVVTVAANEELAEKALNGVLDDIERHEPGLVTRSEIEFLA
ncbi:MAG TPA: DUF503 domain-containing protein [Vicinamibacterales bacterium]|nr:DUF503 domain-containing protein [Vicinamibacterales bacterium]